METQVAVLVPSKEKRYFLLTDTGKKVLKTEELIEWLERSDGAPLLGPMGGSGQNFFVRAFQLGKEVHRIPWFQLEEAAGVTVGATPEERAEGILRAWQNQPALFYRFGLPDADVLMVRELTRVRLNIQEYRKMATLQYKAAFRDLEPLLSEGRKFIALRTMFADPGMIQGALADEEELERRIKQLVEKLPIWHWLHPEKGSPLPRVLGLGPSLGGSLIGEIGDIRNFPAPENLRSYARLHVTLDGEFPRRKKGEVSSWNRYLNRALWLWSTDQMPRYDHVWRHLYDYRKANELQAHPEPVARKVVDRRNRERTVWDFTLKHCDSRAKRWVAVKLLNYVFDVWSAGEIGSDPEGWYPGSRWPAFFRQVETDLAGGLATYLEAEIPKRRRREPEEEVEEEL
ncbi:MAG: transposase [bacterium]|nr:transposase [bacterium]